MALACCFFVPNKIFYILVISLISLEILAKECMAFYSNQNKITTTATTIIEKNVKNFPEATKTLYVGTAHASEILSMSTSLATDSLLSCSGLIVINHHLKKHAMAHVFLLSDGSALARLRPVYEMFQYWGLDFLQGAEIYVVPGRAYHDSFELAQEVFNFIQNFNDRFNIKSSQMKIVESTEDHEAKVATVNGVIKILSNQIFLNQKNDQGNFWPREAYKNKFGKNPLDNEVLEVINWRSTEKYIQNRSR